MLEMCAFGITKSKLPNESLCPTYFGRFVFLRHCCGVPRAEATSMTVSHKLNAGIPSSCRQTSKEKISATVLLCETAGRFLRDL